jgi:hypothetical protein
MPQDTQAVSSATCHSVANGTTRIDDLKTQIKGCTTSSEEQRLASFTDILRTTEQIDNLKTTITNELITGDAMFSGIDGYSKIGKDVQLRNTELNEKKEKLTDEIHKKEKIINSANRDFTDIKDKADTTKILFFEDYTMFFLALSYLFMICMFIYVYTYMSEVPLYGFGKALGGSVLFTIAGSMLLYNII